MILAALILSIAVNVPQKHFALSLPCDWLYLKHNKKFECQRIWWPTSDRVRIHLVPLNRDGLPTYPDKDFHYSWIASSKLPAQDIMPDPPHCGEYTLRYMFLDIQVRMADNKYCLINGTINLWHWHRLYPDYLTNKQAKAITTKGRLLYREDNYDKNDVAYIYMPPGQISDDPMVLYIQLPPLPDPILEQVSMALDHVKVVPKDFHI